MIEEIDPDSNRLMDQCATVSETCGGGWVEKGKGWEIMRLPATCKMSLPEAIVALRKRLLIEY